VSIILRRAYVFPVLLPMGKREYFVVMYSVFSSIGTQGRETLVAAGREIDYK
jgi:hypothetical protein